MIIQTLGFLIPTKHTLNLYENIETKEAISLLIQSEIEQKMLAEINQNYSFKVIDEIPAPAAETAAPAAETPAPAAETPAPAASKTDTPEEVDFAPEVKVTQRLLTVVKAKPIPIDSEAYKFG